MKRKVVIICLIILLLIIGIIIIYNKAEKNNSNTIDTNFAINSEKVENDIQNQNEITEVINNITIKGIVELKRDKYIYIFNGQHFGEFGFEMDEYNSLSLNNNNQKCIDYFTSEEYDTNYIQEGDILIYTGNLFKTSDGNFNTGDNPIIVLKSEDYNKMKKEALKGERDREILVGEYFSSSNEIYLKYNISDKTYKLPFALKLNIAADTEITGELKQGAKVSVQFNNVDVPLDELELKSIKVIGN